MSTREYAFSSAACEKLLNDRRTGDGSLQVVPAGSVTPQGRIGQPRVRRASHGAAIEYFRAAAYTSEAAWAAPMAASSGLGARLWVWPDARGDSRAPYWGVGSSVDRYTG
jgi:hypothetical protein